MNQPTKTNQLTRFIIILGVILMLISPYLARAEQSTPQKGITVAPAVVAFSIESSDLQKTAPVGVTNNSNNRVSIVAQIMGVDAANGILAPSKALDESLKDVITIDKKEFVLEPGESTDILVSVRNDNSLNPGGTYAALVISQAEKSPGTISMQSAVAAGIFVTKQKGAVRNLSLKTFDIKQLLFNEPSSINLGFNNEGNTHVVPRGVVSTITNNNADLYQKGIINQESLTLLPGKEIMLEVPLATVKKATKPGRQIILVQYRFDGSDEIKSVTKTIWYIPAYLYLVVLGLLILLILVTIKITKRKPQKRKYSVEPALEHAHFSNPQKKIKIHDQADGEIIPVRRG